MKKSNSSTTFPMRSAAKMIRFPGGERKFMAWLRSKNYLMSNNEPYQRFVDNGWFILATRTIHKANPQFTVPVTRVTINGLHRLERLVFDEFHKSKCP